MTAACLVMATFAAYMLIGNALVVAVARRGERRRCRVWFEVEVSRLIDE